MIKQSDYRRLTQSYFQCITLVSFQSLVDSFEHADSGELEDLQKIKFPESIMQKICSYFAQPQFAPGDS